MLETALSKAAHWPDAVRVAVNLSSYELARDDLEDIVKAALAGSGQTGARLELEVTETALIQHHVESRAGLLRLRALDVKIAMDDFGTGYASLSHLRSFPFDRIKIDRSFIAGLTESSEGAAIVRALLQPAATLNIATTAEGVETADQLALLAGSGCREAQGLLFSRHSPPVKWIACWLAGLRPPTSLQVGLELDAAAAGLNRIT